MSKAPATSNIELDEDQSQVTPSFDFLSVHGHDGPHRAERVTWTASSIADNHDYDGDADNGDDSNSAATKQEMESENIIVSSTTVDNCQQKEESTADIALVLQQEGPCLKPKIRKVPATISFFSSAMKKRPRLANFFEDAPSRPARPPNFKLYTHCRCSDASLTY
ncbi:uncharacterized protein BYT42DRAFT_612332 [Radiomyces spectabilis]|uniref:uncharacterized protein n=1 Tax=Radiomyces spectabilis TaxID=64574 RepID=UPI00221FBF6B|nr:uncharacterized protein BYT42DRAFT_612332 [Radiomyces spectabilis]KAI8384646.1 hypothetical protein BYT42DRAFT_612332 [Radiomyces spectabilis]